MQRGPHGLFTWVVKADKTVEPRPIKSGATTGDRTIVTSGLSAGERVVTDGQYKLQTGAPVTVTNPRRRDEPGRLAVNISEPFIRRPVATTLLMAALAFVGIVSFPFLPVAPLPQVDFPTIQVSTTLAGASAETMATRSPPRSSSSSARSPASPR